MRREFPPLTGRDRREGRCRRALPTIDAPVPPTSRGGTSRTVVLASGSDSLRMRGPGLQRRHLPVPELCLHFNRAARPDIPDGL
jgi:hypothetical protein